MGRSRRIEDIFEECLELVFKGESIDDCVNRYPAHEAELRELLETAVITRRAVSVEPSPEFRQRARQQLYAAQRDMAAAPSRKRTRPWWDFQPRWAAGVATFVMLVMAGSGTVLASVGSMPGQPLYAVKHAAESARVALTFSSANKAELYASLADQRVNEIVYLAEKGDSRQLQKVTQDLDSYLSEISDLSGGVEQEGILAAESQRSSLGAGTVAPATTSPPERATAPSFGQTAAPTTGPAEKSLAPPDAGSWASQPADSSAADTQPPVTVARPPLPATLEDQATDVSGPWAKLKARISLQATQHIAMLRAALDKAPPEARPALLHAIAVSQSGYEKALQALEDQP